MADVSQIKLPNGSVYDLIDEKSGYITAEYIENKTDYEIPVSRVGEIVVGETAIGTDSTNFPTSKAVVDYVDERVVQEIAAIDFDSGITGIQANGTSLPINNGVVNIPAIGPNQSVGLMTDQWMQQIWNGLHSIPTSTSQLTNDSGFITSDSDEKVRSYDMSAQTNAHYDLMLSQNSESASTKYRDHGYLYYDRDSTTARLTIGAASRSGIIRLINSTGVSTDLISSATSVTKTITLPNTNGTIALTSDIRPAFFSGSSPTSASLTEKIVNCKSFTSSDLKSGAAILVNFAYTNTAQASSVQLNVNQTGAKNIKFINNGTRGNLPSNPVLKSGAPLLFIYDGSYWVAYFNYDTTYSKMSESVMQNGTSSSEYLISADILKQAIIYHAPVQSVNGQTGAISLTIPSKISDLTNDSGFISSYTETDPVFSASAAAGITSTDISNWNAKVSDDKTWNGVRLGVSGTYTAADQYIPVKATNALSGTASQIVATQTPAQYRIAKYDDNAYLNSTTPSANDNSTKVATTAYVDSAIPKVYSSTNTGGYLTMATLPIYDGTVE